jgi:hypothetical protein
MFNEIILMIIGNSNYIKTKSKIFFNHRPHLNRPVNTPRPPKPINDTPMYDTIFVISNFQFMYF